MARAWKPRTPDASRSPTTIHEICRRYYACATTLAKVMGVPVSETFIKEHRESISCCFIESGRAGVQVPASVTLAPLQATSGAREQGTPPDEPVPDVTPPIASPNGQGDHPSPGDHPPPNGDALLPSTIPADGDLPCRGQEIATLKPAALAMLVAKTATLAHAEGAGWAPLLAALQAERQHRLVQGQRRR